ncbi:hypothetical protein BHE74_00005296 [Ensete ventricosum]|nr:hypothetical protein BHE74_00005296 [Ensete ventricosum]
MGNFFSLSGNFFSLSGEKKRLPAWGRKTGMPCAYHSISGTIPYRTELSMPVRTSMAILYSICILLSPYYIDISITILLSLHYQIYSLVSWIWIYMFISLQDILF